MYGNSNMETYITICKIDSQQEFAVWLRKLKQGLCINIERGMGREKGGRFKREWMYIYLWLIHVEVWKKQENSVKHYPSIKNKLYIYVCVCVCVCVCIHMCSVPTVIFNSFQPYSLPGSSVRRFLQIRVLEWLTCPPPGNLSHPGMELASPAL